MRIISIVIALSFALVTHSITPSLCPPRCHCKGDTVICRYAHIKKLPDRYPQYTRRLAIQRNPLSVLPTSAFGPLYGQSLDELDLSRNKISDIAKDAFKGLTHLKRLSLSNNELMMLPHEVFKPLMYLEVLNLENNKLKMLPQSLEGLVYLNTIKLRSNRLECSGCDLLYLTRDQLRHIEYPPRITKCHTPKIHTRKSLTQLSNEDFRCEMKTMADMMNPQPPRITVKPMSQTATPGDQRIFNCEAEGYPKPTLTWLLPTPRLDDNMPMMRLPNVSSYIRFMRRNQTLRITEVHGYHSGMFTCVAENRLGIHQETAQLSLDTYLKPQVVEGPRDQSVYQGEDVPVYCRVYGRPEPKISWFRERRGDSVMISNDNHNIIRPSMLILRNISLEQSGKYICYSSNREGFTRISAEILVMPKETKMKENKDMSMKNMTNTMGVNTNGTSQQILVQSIIDKSRNTVGAVIDKTIKRLRDTDNRRNDIRSLFRHPNRAAVELSRASFIYEVTLEEISNILRQHQVQFNFSSGGRSSVINGGGFNNAPILTTDQLLVISQLSGCQTQAGQSEELRCQEELCFHKQYRSEDGTCNNLNHYKWGAAPAPFRRILEPQYENGVNTPIGWNAERLYYGYPKPSARLVSRELLATEHISADQDFTVMLMQWGQFLDHDLTFTPVDASQSRFSGTLNCNETCVNDPPCFPILTPPRDPRVHKRCIGFTRSIATCGSGSTSLLLGRPHYREQINQITSYLDASNVYGSEALLQNQLRENEYDEGELRVGVPTPSGKSMMPFNIRGLVDCQSDAADNLVNCFKAGDHRSNENLGLLSLHTMWMREHNRIVRQLRFLNPHWTGDKLYNEGRKIVGGMHQFISYNHWLPYILGEEGMARLGTYQGYDDQLDSTISNAFATAAFRFGHGLIQPFQYRLDKNFKEIKEGHLPLHKAFFAPRMILKDGGLDPIVRGMFVTPGKQMRSDEAITDAVTERLFKVAHEIALDLAALNIQRGRDHALPSYNEWRRYCGLSWATTFSDLATEIPSAEVREGLRKVYGHPGNIDLFAGGILETPMAGGRVGPTFGCIIVEQFRRTRAGDRFWFENPDVFTSAQRSQLRQASLARIICDNADNITRVQLDVFRRVDSPEEFVDCAEIPKINLISWKECVGYVPPHPLQQVPFNRRRRSADHKSLRDEKQAQLENDYNQLKDRLTQLEQLVASKLGN